MQKTLQVSRFLSTETPPQKHRPYNRAGKVGNPAGNPRTNQEQTPKTHRDSGTLPRPERFLHRSSDRIGDEVGSAVSGPDPQQHHGVEGSEGGPQASGDSGGQ